MTDEGASKIRPRELPIVVAVVLLDIAGMALAAVRERLSGRAFAPRGARLARTMADAPMREAGRPSEAHADPAIRVVPFPKPAGGKKAGVAGEAET